MNTENFIKNIANQFDETAPELINLETRFKEIEEWSSLIALSIIAMADEEYKISLTGDDIRSSSTVNDLYNIVKSKL